MQIDPYADPHERRMQVQSLVKTPERPVNQGLRTQLIDLALRMGEHPDATSVVKAAQAFEAYITGKEPTHV